jgi:hypothetical protein
LHNNTSKADFILRYRCSITLSKVLQQRLKNR